MSGSHDSQVMGFLFRALKSGATSIVFILAGVSATAPAAIVHQYELNGSFADALGGPALVPGGAGGVGTLTATGYDFLANQGLTLSNGLTNNATYSLLIDFSFANVSGYRKIVDFLDKTSDYGLYVYGSDLIFYTGADGTGSPFQDNVPARLVLTRDDSSDEVAGYVNGIQQFSFTDSGGIAVFAAGNDVMNFFTDDAVTGFGEASAGSVDHIVVYDTPLSASEVANLSGIPEPANFAAVGGLLAAGLMLRNRRSKA